MTHYDHPARIMAAESHIALLKAALREALNGWRDKKTLTNEQFQRIAELRAQFLDDK